MSTARWPAGNPRRAMSQVTSHKFQVTSDCVTGSQQSEVTSRSRVTSAGYPMPWLGADLSVCPYTPQDQTFPLAGLAIYSVHSQSIDP